MVYEVVTTYLGSISSPIINYILNKQGPLFVPLLKWLETPKLLPQRGFFVQKLRQKKHTHIVGPLWLSRMQKSHHGLRDPMIEKKTTTDHNGGGSIFLGIRHASICDGNFDAKIGKKMCEPKRCVFLHKKCSVFLMVMNSSLGKIHKKNH